MDIIEMEIAKLEDKIQYHYTTREDNADFAALCRLVKKGEIKTPFMTVSRASELLEDRRDDHGHLLAMGLERSIKFHTEKISEYSQQLDGIRSQIGHHARPNEGVNAA